ncbi:TPA: hypothetical protein N0F65_010113 [Lagenidium giganteum]|uniref:1-alkyl-2-acetylglycerophosphocholine esterase n=1 Tax=Lagenidium giganteum TaxID=4803 RepID=A0AAV2YJ06_9STRA|nr:TPA: hypothetical protein N0F65_010113 [Lagenidium giganteum]
MPSAKFQAIEYGLLASLTAGLALDHTQIMQHTQHDVAIAVTSIATVTLLALHRWRRELFTAYVAIGVYAYLHAVEWRSWSATAAVGWKVTSFKLSALGVLVAWMMALLFPLPDFTSLTGPYKTIGCHTGRYGGVECRVFYPSSRDAPTVPPTKRIRYLHHGVHLAKGLSVFSRLPHWMFNNLSNAFLSSIDEAPIATPPTATGWPVIIFSHGLAGSLELYSINNEQMASHGHIVVVINHCDGSASVARPEDERVEYYQRVTKEVLNNVDGAGFRFRNSQLRHRVQEVRRVLNAVEKEHKQHAPGSIFAQMDMDRVNVSGHSFGAATAMTAAHIDNRFKHAILLDGWMFPVTDEVKQGVGSRIPVVHIISEHFANWKENMDDMKKHMYGCTHPQSALLVLEGSRHNNFSDLPLFSPIVNRLVLASGKIDPRYALEATASLSAAFLRGDMASLLSSFPEMKPVVDLTI